MSIVPTVEFDISDDGKTLVTCKDFGWTKVSFNTFIDADKKIKCEGSKILNATTQEQIPAFNGETPVITGSVIMTMSHTSEYESGKFAYSPLYHFGSYSGYIDNIFVPKYSPPDEVLKLIGRIDSEIELSKKALILWQEMNDVTIIRNYYFKNKYNHNLDLFCALSHLLNVLSFSYKYLSKSENEEMRWLTKEYFEMQQLSDITRARATIAREIFSFLIFWDVCTNRVKSKKKFKKRYPAIDKCSRIRNAFVHPKDNIIDFDFSKDDFCISHTNKNKQSIYYQASEIVEAFKEAWKYLIDSHEKMYRDILDGLP